MTMAPLYEMTEFVAFDALKHTWLMSVQPRLTRLERRRVAEAFMEHIAESIGLDPEAGCYCSSCLPSPPRADVVAHERDLGDPGA
jgi:hypothetical protein